MQNFSNSLIFFSIMCRMYITIFRQIYTTNHTDNKFLMIKFDFYFSALFVLKMDISFIMILSE